VFENTLKKRGSYEHGFCLGDKLSVADIFLIPQVYNAIGYKLDLKKYPGIMSIYNHTIKLPPVTQALPEYQPDAPKL